MRNLFALAALFTSLVTTAARVGATPPVAAELVEVNKIWDSAAHNAFTDLIHFRDHWYCGFREGEKHVSPAGKLRVIRSSDGEKWESTGLLELPNYDLRDACLSETPDGRLMLLGGAQQATPTSYPTATVVSFSENGSEWSEPQIVFPLGQWLWRVTWNGERAYGIVYGRQSDGGNVSLVSTSDGVNYQPIKPAEPFPTGYLTEARVRFDADGTCYWLQRRDGQENTALLGRATAPYEQWEWRDLGQYFGGPNFVKSPEGDWIGAGRIIGQSAKTHVAWIDVENATLTSLLELPSGGDCSYPGMVWKDGLLWISYYSSHEGKTSIYLAKVKVTAR